MSIILRTNIDARRIVDDIKGKIDNGEIATWSYDGDGDFTHSVDQWANRAWMRPVFFEDNPTNMVFAIVGRKGLVISMEEYSIYHGRFVETLLKYYSKYIGSMQVTVPKGSPLDSSNINF